MTKAFEDNWHEKVELLKDKLRTIDLHLEDLELFKSEDDSCGFVIGDVEYKYNYHRWPHICSKVYSSFKLVLEEERKLIIKNLKFMGEHVE